jgi:uncharacterized membrane protein
MEWVLQRVKRREHSNWIVAQLVVFATTKLAVLPHHHALRAQKKLVSNSSTILAANAGDR